MAERRYYQKREYVGEILNESPIRAEVIISGVLTPVTQFKMRVEPTADRPSSIITVSIQGDLQGRELEQLFHQGLLGRDMEIAVRGRAGITEFDRRDGRGRGEFVKLHLGHPRLDDNIRPLRRDR